MPANHTSSRNRFQKANGPRFCKRGPSGGLVDIDQEVVTLRGPFGTIRVPARPMPDAPIFTRLQPNSIKLTHRSCKRGWLLARTIPRPGNIRATALSLSHLTWSLISTTIATTIRTCHPTTSFPV